jgi:hypothetical protein
LRRRWRRWNHLRGQSTCYFFFARYFPSLFSYDV